GKRTVFCGNNLGTELQLAATLFRLLDDLNPLTRHLQLPIALFRLRKEVAQRINPIPMGLEHFTNQIAGKIHVALTHRQHRTKVGSPNGAEQVKHRPLLQEAGSKPGKRPEQKRRLTIDNAGVQVRNRHRRRTDRRLAINLGVMLGNDVGLLAHKPLTTDREAAITTSFINTGFLQQWQRTATGPKENKAGFQLGQLTGELVLDPQFPTPVVTLVNVMNRGIDHQFKVGLGLQPLDHTPGQRAKIHIRAMLDASSCNPLHRVTIADNQRHPLSQIFRAFGVFHFPEQVMRFQALETTLEEGDVFLAPNETLVWRSIYKARRFRQYPLLNKVRPELE